jgi:DNA-binding response OmpR family regulator
MKRILLIEDDEALRQTLAIALEEDGFSVVSTGDGRTAYSGDTGHRFRRKLATCRSEATLGFHFTSGWPA